MEKFCEGLSQYSRRKTLEVHVGKVTIGGNNPICIQSMTNTDTNDTTASVAQIQRIADAGGEIVRLTAQGKREAANLANIESELHRQGYDTPLVADIHFVPSAALVAAENVEKVRINPGNFNDKGGDFLKLLEICKRRKVALRIGVNHGSLAPEIVEKYGDTPEGMVASAMQFLKLCRDNSFSQVVVSMKSSNVRVMVQAYRMLTAEMRKENMEYPLHLGVTEAGNGEDGRIKSAVGIGALLADGIGDTIRVSLTEAPENEIPVAQMLADYFQGRENHKPIPQTNESLYFPYTYKKRISKEISGVGGNNLPIIWSELPSDIKDSVFEVSISDIDNIPKDKIVLLTTDNINGPAEQRAFFLKMEEAGKDNPVIIKRSYRETSLCKLQVKAAADTGILFLDGFGDGLFIENIAPQETETASNDSKNNKVTIITTADKTTLYDDKITSEKIDSLSLAILQAARVRTSKTEYIACPSCGRTLYNIEEALAKIQSRTSHLKGLKIGVMGCIVNGPGEMADADYGYVGAGPGRITLYKGQTIIRRNIPEENAVNELIELIKENGDWIYPDSTVNTK